MTSRGSTSHERPFRVYLGDEEHRAHARHRLHRRDRAPDRPRQRDKLQGRASRYCAVCDAAFFRDKQVVVVGGGDSAMEEATSWRSSPPRSSWCTAATPSAPRRSCRTVPRRTRRSSSCATRWWRRCWATEGHVTGVRLRDTATGELSELPADGLFVAIGHDPNTGLFKGMLDMDEAGYLMTKPGIDATNIDGRVRRRRRRRPHLPPGRHRRRAWAAWRPSTPSAGSRTRSPLRSGPPPPRRPESNSNTRQYSV